MVLTYILLTLSVPSYNRILFQSKIHQKCLCISMCLLNLFCYKLQFVQNQSEWHASGCTYAFGWMQSVTCYTVLKYELQDIVWHKAEWKAEQWTVCFVYVADKPETAGYRSSTSSYTWNGSSQFSNQTTSRWCDSKYNKVPCYLFLRQRVLFW